MLRIVKEQGELTFKSAKVQNIRRTYTEDNSDGFSIAVHPAAKAGATFHVAINSG